MTFVTELGVTPLPASPEVICLYIAYMVRSFKYVTIINYVSALRSLHKCYSITPVSSDNFLVSSTLTGAKRLLGDGQFSSDPLLPPQLYSIYKVLDLEKQDELVFWTAVLLCFRGLLRKSSVCQGIHCIQRKDTEFTDWGMLLYINSSKTIQFKQRVHVVPIATVKGPLCAVSFMRTMVGRIPAKPTYNMFGVYKSNVYKTMTYEFFAKKLKSVIGLTGLSRQGKFTSHSLRRGGATALSLAGVPLHEIQRRGDWKSLSVLLYLSSPLDHRISQENDIAARMVEIGIDHT